MNKSLEHYLRSFSSDRPTEWLEWLYLAEYWFNTNYHITATKLTLNIYIYIYIYIYISLYGFAPPRLMHYIPGTTRVAVVDCVLKSRQHFLLC